MPFRRIKVLGDNIIVRFLPQPEGLILSGAVARDPIEAEVTAVGSGRVLNNGQIMPLDVSVGDRVVVMPQHAATKQTHILRNAILDEQEVFIKLDDILYVIK